MFAFATPHSLFQAHVHTLRGTLPGVFDGAVESIHDARISTRRIRELLPLLGGSNRDRLEDLYARFKTMGHSLGRVREADARICLLESLQTRIPHAAPALVVLRQRREEDRHGLMRRLIKRLERLQATSLIESLDSQALTVPLTHAWRTRTAHNWRTQLERAISERARTTADSIRHATGIYFPRRAHSARIAIKRLRYAMEIAAETGSSESGGAIRELKKAQDLLGELHDRQDLVDSLMESAQGDADGAPEVPLVKQVIDAECRELHQKYLAKREALLAICRREPRIRTVPRTALAAAGMVGFTSSLYLARQRMR